MNEGSQAQQTKKIISLVNFLFGFVHWKHQNPVTDRLGINKNKELTSIFKYIKRLLLERVHACGLTFQLCINNENWRKLSRSFVLQVLNSLETWEIVRK